MLRFQLITSHKHLLVNTFTPAVITINRLMLFCMYVLDYIMNFIIVLIAIYLRQINFQFFTILLLVHLLSHVNACSD